MPSTTSITTDSGVTVWGNFYPNDNYFVFHTNSGDRIRYEPGNGHFIECQGDGYGALSFDADGGAAEQIAHLITCEGYGNVTSGDIVDLVGSLTGG